MANEEFSDDKLLFGEQKASLTPVEVMDLIGQVDWNNNEYIKTELRNVRERVIAADIDHNGKLEGDEIKAAGLEEYARMKDTKIL